MEKSQQDDLNKLKELQEKMEPFVKEIEKDPLIMICKLHKTTREEVIKLRKERSWRVLADATSHGKCSNQICGWFLCIDAGIDKGPWETE